MADDGLLSLSQRKGDGKPDAAALADALSAMAQAPFLDVIKNMTTDLEKLMVESKQAFQKQRELCDRFRALVAEHRPIRNEALSIVLTLKAVADNATYLLIPVLRCALDDSDVSSVMETIHEMIDGTKKVYKRLSDLKVLHDAIVRKAQELINPQVEAESIGSASSSLAQGLLNPQLEAGTGSWQGEERINPQLEAECAGCACSWHLAVGVLVGVLVGALVGKLADVLSPHADATTAYYPVTGALAGVLVGALVGSLFWVEAHQAPMPPSDLIAKLDGQCTSLQLMIERLQLMLNGLVASADSAEKFQHVIEAWSEEGHQRKKLSELRYRLWLDKKFPKEMAELSKRCEEYTRKEAKERESILIAMNTTDVAATCGQMAKVNNFCPGIGVGALSSLLLGAKTQNPGIFFPWSAAE